MNDNEKAMFILATICIIFYIAIMAFEYVAVEDASKTPCQKMLEYERKHPEKFQGKGLSDIGPLR